MKRIKSILINLPVPFLDDDERQPPGGLVHIATYVKSRGYDIQVRDLSNLKEDDLCHHIDEADIYGIGTYTANYGLTLRFLHTMRLRHPRALYVAGGPHASALPREVSKNFDIVVSGEGEEAFLSIIRDVEAGIKPEKILFADPIEDLDSLPFPDYEYFCNMKKYTRRMYSEPVMCLDSSRGCNFNCRFCNSVVNKRGFWRSRSPEKIFSEVKLHYDNGWYAFRFNDDNFLADTGRAYKICELLQPLQIRWRIFARAESLTYDLCKTLYASGCKHISVGIESLCPSMLARMGKATSVMKIIQGMENTYKAGIITRGFFIVGFPGETDDTIQETIDNLDNLKLNEATVYPCLAYPGTDIYQRPEYYNITWIDSDYSKYIQIGRNRITGYTIRTKDFGPAEVIQWRLRLIDALNEKCIIWSNESSVVI
ncbi:MAG: radical SAM protein [Spirochaetales bacterium]|nr:radical SAM protein [Spirochaetales bacterium]